MDAPGVGAALNSMFVTGRGDGSGGSATLARAGSGGRMLRSTAADGDGVDGRLVHLTGAVDDSQGWIHRETAKPSMTRRAKPT